MSAAAVTVTIFLPLSLSLQQCCYAIPFGLNVRAPVNCDKSPRLFPTARSLVRFPCDCLSEHRGSLNPRINTAPNFALASSGQKNDGDNDDHIVIVFVAAWLRWPSHRQRYPAPSGIRPDQIGSSIRNFIGNRAVSYCYSWSREVGEEIPQRSKVRCAHRIGGLNNLSRRHCRRALLSAWAGQKLYYRCLPQLALAHCKCNLGFIYVRVCICARFLVESCNRMMLRSAIMIIVTDWRHTSSDNRVQMVCKFYLSANMLLLYRDGTI